MRALKILLASIASLVVLAMVALLALVLLVDPNAYKGYLTDWVAERTGRPLTIEGDLELSFLPRLALEGERVMLGHPPGFDFSEPFATVERITAGVELLPLLERRLEIGRIRIDGARFNLVRGADGRGNWQDFRADPAEPGASADDFADKLDIERVEIRNAELRWYEEASGPRYVLSDIALETGRIRAGEPVEASLSLSAEDTASARRFAVETRSLVGLAALGAAAEDAVVTLRDFRLTLRAFDPMGGEIAAGVIETDGLDAARDGRVEIAAARLDGRSAATDADPDGLDFGAAWNGLRFDPRSGTLTVDALETRLAGITAEWQLDARDVIDAPRIEGELRIADAALGPALDAFGVALPNGVDPDTLGNIDAGGTLRVALSLGDGAAYGAAGASAPAAIGPYLIDELSVTELSIETLGAVLRGEAALGRDGVLRGMLSTTPIAPEALGRLLGDLMPDAISPAELGSLEIDARFEYDARAGQLDFDDVTLAVFGLEATGRAVITGLGGAVAASGEAQTAPFSPRELMQRFGQPVPEASDPAALQRAVVQTRFDADESGGRFRDIELVLDDTRITGEYAIDGLVNPAHQFRLAIDRVNVDRYLPPRSAELADGADADARTAGDIELPSTALAALRIDGEVSVGDLRLAGLEFRDVATRIDVGGGRAALDPARATLYGGEFTGRFEVDTRAEPALRLTGRATSLELAPIITALTGDANISGTGSFDIDLAGNGTTVLDNVAAASGRVAFSMRDGVIDGFNLGRTLCAVYNTVRLLPAPAEQPSRTAYVSIGGTATVQDGVATSRDLLARTTFLDLTGEGHLALAEQRLDYTLEATLTGSTGIDSCEALDQLSGESLPLTLRGTVTDPTIRPDFSEIIQRRLRDVVRGSLQDRLRDLLR